MLHERAGATQLASSTHETRPTRGGEVVKLQQVERSASQSGFGLESLNRQANSRAVLDCASEDASVRASEGVVESMQAKRGACDALVANQNKASPLSDSSLPRPSHPIHAPPHKRPHNSAPADRQST